jgi:hypothetical protein
MSNEIVFGRPKLLSEFRQNLVKWMGREADHSPPYSAEVKNSWNYTSSPQYAFRENFTLLYLWHRAGLHQTLWVDLSSSHFQFDVNNAQVKLHKFSRKKEAKDWHMT